MLSLTHLMRDLKHHRHDRAFRALVSNGLFLPSELHGLAARQKVTVAALSLRRALELTKLPGEPCLHLAREIISQQQSDGSWVGGLLPTLTAYVALRQAAKELGDGHVPANLQQSLAQAELALEGMQTPEGWLRDPDSDHPKVLVSVVAMMMLEDAGAQGLVRDRLEQVLRAHERELDASSRTIWELTCAGRRVQRAARAA